MYFKHDLVNSGSNLHLLNCKLPFSEHKKEHEENEFVETKIMKRNTYQKNFRYIHLQN